MSRLVHVSDLHHQLDWRKRSLISTGWRGALGRFELHAMGRLAKFEGVRDRISRLLEQLWREDPDHVLLTGDLTSLGDEEELAGVFALLAPLIEARKLTLIPGNHDRYTDAPGQRRFERIFAQQLKSDLPQYAVLDGYPFVHLVGAQLAIVGLDSTQVSGVNQYFVGRIGAAQLGALEKILADPRLAARKVLVLSHHGPLGPGGTAHWIESGLLDGARLMKVLHGRPVVLHHGHSHQRYWHRAAEGRPHIFGGGSSTELGTAGYWVIELEDHQRVSAREVKSGV